MGGKKKRKWMGGGKAMRLNELLTKVAVFHGFTPEELKERNQKREKIDARMIFYHLAHTSEIHKQEIANFVGRDRTTVLHAIQVADGLLQTNRKFRDRYTEVHKSISIYE